MVVERVEVTSEQKFIMAKAATAVRSCLDVVEVFALEDSRREKLKQLIENAIYSYRDDMLRKLTIPQKAQVKTISGKESV